tara:strand:+ start:497 stop:628 length:132 start_codon:yes stop_codon:yes gene_type:complete
MSTVAMGFPLDLLLAFQLFHPFLFSRDLLRLMGSTPAGGGIVS